MTDSINRSSRTSRRIDAAPAVIYRAFTDPSLLAHWQAPGDMTATVHAFDLRVGGGYEMSLTYPWSGQDARGKTTAREDRYTARFVELIPSSRIVEVITFATSDPAFMGEMTMEVTLDAHANQTDVTIAFTNIPPGIRPEDNDEGTRLSLEKLAALVEKPELAGTT
ncbi:MAG TPA: SRPBCC domain-containing protein [Thermomicrobiales bacterium]|nr:SRPBCC domain-containing protein [Thermomicrobiales bacterium]